jgi:hypothetical protein
MEGFVIAGVDCTVGAQLAAMHCLLHFPQRYPPRAQLECSTLTGQQRDGK